MEPENGPLEDYFPLRPSGFQGARFMIACTCTCTCTVLFRPKHGCCDRARDLAEKGLADGAEARARRRGGIRRDPSQKMEEPKGLYSLTANGSAATCTVQHVHICMYHMYFGSRIKRLGKVRFPFRRYAAYGPSVIASNFAD